MKSGIRVRKMVSDRTRKSPANSLIHRVPDPITNRYRFKLGKAQIEKIGESPYKDSFEEMTFKPRTVSTA